jgi:CGNR zinc finger/Putative stress-induced transcription regulator
MSETWPASERFGLSGAPGGVAFVQDFLNTRAIESHPDLLADPALAGTWLTKAVQAWSATRGNEISPPALTSTDLSKLRVLRATIAELLLGATEVGHGIGSTSASFRLSGAGAVQLEPAGGGWRWLASALWGEILVSQHTGAWRRLKQCHNPDCRSTFYDRSKNNSGVWHNVKVCGNAANLRASRARRRERADPAALE